MSTLSSMLGAKFAVLPGLKSQPHTETHGSLRAPDSHEVLMNLLHSFEFTAGFNSESIGMAGAKPLTRQQLMDGPVPKEEKVTKFHSVRVPKYSLSRTGTILCQNFQTTNEIMIAAVVILIRYCEATEFRPTLHSMHRMLAAAVCLAMKTHCDFYFSNPDAGYACGLCVEEVNRLEATLCLGTDWRLLVLSEEIADRDGLLERISQLRHYLREAPRPLHLDELSSSSCFLDQAAPPSFNAATDKDPLEESMMP